MSLGTGLSLPVAKAMAHLMITHAALTRPEWSITNEAIREEIQEAQTHIRDITPDGPYFEAMSEDCKETLRTLSAEMDMIFIEADEANQMDPDAEPNNSLKTIIEALASRSWAYLAAIDGELTGVETDPGTLP